MEKVEAFIIDSDPNRRLRLRSALAAIPRCGKIEQHTLFRTALPSLKNGRGVTVLFISAGFESAVTQEFIKLAKSTERGVDSAYVSTLSSKSGDSIAVTKGLMDGVDSFLLEPFSVEGLDQACTLAQSLYLTRKRHRQEKAIEFAVNNMIKYHEEVYRNLIAGREPGVALRSLRELSTFARELDEDLQPFYYATLTGACESSPARIAFIQKNDDASLRAEKRLEERLKQFGVVEATNDSNQGSNPSNVSNSSTNTHRVIIRKK